MNYQLFLHAFFVWLGLFAGAFFNGALREILIKNIFNIPEPWAHHLSVLTAIFILSAITFFFWNKIAIKNLKESFVVGAFWLLLTILAETFIISRWLGHASWEQIVSHYFIWEGQSWPVVLLWIGVMPVLFKRVLNG